MAKPSEVQTKMGAERSSSGPWTVLALLQWTTAHFEEQGIETARLDAECLLAHALECDRLRLYLDFEKPVEEAERGRFRELVRARSRDRVPVAYLTGEREFWSLPLRVTPAVLIPRPETETLVETVLETLRDRSEARVLEIGTGSGAIALALAKERPDLELWASDDSPEALEVARGNAEALGIGAEIRWCEGDLFEALHQSGDAPSFDLVVSNPPYVAEADREGLAPELAHEPEGALFAGPDGLVALRRLVESAPDHLGADGALCVELDPRQVPALRRLAEAAGFDRARAIRDAKGAERVLVLERGPVLSAPVELD